MESGSGYHRPEDVDRAAGGAEVECSRQQHGTHVECQWHYGEEIALIVLTDLRDVFFSSGRRRTRYWRDWSSDVCSSDLPIQAATIPDALAGRDVLGKAQTGSGKTLAFGLPLLARLAGTKAAPKRPRGLVLVPTREQIGRASCRDRV